MALKKYQKTILYSLPILIGLFFIYRTVRAGTKKPDLAPIPPPVPTPPTPAPADCKNKPINRFPMYGLAENSSDWTTRSGSRLREDHSTSSRILKTYPAGVRMISIDEVWSDENTNYDYVWYKVTEAGNHCVVGWMREDVIDNVPA